MSEVRIKRISPEKFSVTFEYDLKLTNLLYHMPSRNFNWDQKEWVFLMSELETLKKLLKENNYSYKIDMDYFQTCLIKKVDDHFEVSFKFSKEIYSMIKKIDGSTFNKEKRVWLISRKKIEQLKKDLKQNNIVCKTSIGSVSNSDSDSDNDRNEK